MEDKITIPLSPTQRDLLLECEPYFADHALFRLISVALKKGKNYEISLDEEELKDLLDQVSSLCNLEEYEKLQDKLDDLCDYLEDFYAEFGEDDEYAEYSSNTGSVCVLKVALANSEEIWRNIAIREGRTLHDLHDVIFEAFDRDDEHMYSFFFPHSAKKLDIRNIHKSSDEYTHPYAYEEQGVFGSDAQNASTVSIESLDLTDGQVFYYLFDFGDEWWHEITVEKIDGTADDEEYPRIIDRKGESPDQYPDPDEDGNYYTGYD